MRHRLSPVTFALCLPGIGSSVTGLSVTGLSVTGLSVIALASAVVACASPEVTVRTKAGSELTGTPLPEASQQGKVVVRSDGAMPVTVALADVEHVEYAGSSATGWGVAYCVLGGALLASGAYLLATSDESLDDLGGGIVLALGGVLAGGGIYSLVRGGEVEEESRQLWDDAVEAAGGQPLSLGPTLVRVQGREPAPGVSLGLRY